MLNLDVVHFCGICVQVFIWTSSVNRPMSKPNPTRTVVATWFWPVCVSVEVWRVLRNCDDHHPVFIVRAAVVVVEVVVKLWCLTFAKRTHFTRSNTRVISNINDRLNEEVPHEVPGRCSRVYTPVLHWHTPTCVYTAYSLQCTTYSLQYVIFEASFIEVYQGIFIIRVLYHHGNSTRHYSNTLHYPAQGHWQRPFNSQPSISALVRWATCDHRNQRGPH